MGESFPLSYPTTFGDFLAAFFGLFSQKTFRRADYLTYLSLPDKSRSGDEAPIIDTAIVSPLLGLLGFEAAERIYNQQRQNGRPDFAPTDSVYGTCFVVEDKSTSLQLTFDLSNPDSHLSQLAGYIRSSAVYLGWLTNGKQFTVWSFNNPQHPTCIIDLDIPATILDWRSHNPPELSPSNEKSLHDLFDLCRKESFTDMQRLEHEMATSIEEWHTQALPLGTGSGNEGVLVETLQLLVMELQRDARRVLDGHLRRYEEYTDKVSRLTDDAPESAIEELKEIRSKIVSILVDTFQLVWGLEKEDIEAIEDILIRLERDARLFISPKEMFQNVLDIINTARQRKYFPKSKAAHPMSTLEDLPTLHNPLQVYIDKGFAWHQRQAALRQEYRNDLNVYDDYVAWKSLVQETMLGGLDEERRRDEFALQAAYVVFIRLLLIRVCEDKGIFPHRFISDGGLKHWQEDMKRYLVFANGNPYSPLLNMAYDNAQNIYAHFFTGRELFNWYHLDRQRLVMALHRLSRFDFAGVDSDIIGTIYNTYVNRKEKREKGQYYTPPAIVNYILDTVGYSGRAIIGSNKRLIDPACGSGTFLVSAAKRFVAAYSGTDGKVGDPLAVLERLQSNLFGFDLNPFACYLAEVNLLIQVLDLIKQAHDVGQRPNIQRFYIYNVDALTRPTGRHYYMHINTLLAEESDTVEQIKSRTPETPYATGFAFVVANPPYGATLSDTYKVNLRSEWADIFYGQPDTYTFFLKLGLELLANDGKLGFITPNTYLMGTHTAALRSKLLTMGRIEQIVDLPQGIWPDANVDCVLLFLAAEIDEEKRKVQQVQINLLGLRDSLDKLTERAWTETIVQQQSRWMADAKCEITIRHNALLRQIEDACRISANGGPSAKVLRLGDVTESSQGIIVYKTKAEGQSNRYIKSRRDVPPTETEWKPLLDGSAFVGRYELRWGSKQPYLKYGNWLWHPREAKYFESPKLILVRLRNKALRRRLIATFDDSGFFNRDNYNNLIAKEQTYDLKYLLALFNSSLLNYWYSKTFDNVNINPESFQQLPVYPTDLETQTVIVALVDEILAKHAELNKLRAQSYTIRHRRDGSALINVPYDKLLSDLLRSRSLPTLTLFDARAIGLFSIPEPCDLQRNISSNIYIPDKYPTSLVLRHNKLWFEVPDENVRRYLLGYLSRPQWHGKTWDDLKNKALIPEGTDALKAFFAAEAQQIDTIQILLDEIKRIDEKIDEQVLDLYGITNAADRQRILGSAPTEEEEETGSDEETIASDPL